MTLNPFSWFGKKKAFSYNLPLTLNKNTSLSHPERDKSRDGVKATAEAQSLRTSNDIMASYGKAMIKGVVGTGTSLQYKSEDSELNSKVEKWLNYWSETGNCNIRTTLYRQSSERLMVSEAVYKGGFLIRHHWDKRFKTLYKFEILSCDNIDRTKNDFSKNLYFGTQVNKRGEIDGIWLYKNNQRQSSNYVKIKNGNTPNITIYLDVWSDPHQYTNITTTATILSSLDRLAAYEDAELDGAKERAKKSIIIANKAYELFITMQQQAIETNRDEADRERQQQQLEEMLKDLTVIGSHDSAINIMPDSEVWDLKQDGNSIYADLSENKKRTMAKALGLSASTLMGIPESSYNVALKNKQEDEQEYSIKGQDLIEVAFKTIYRCAIEAGYLKGRYKLEDYYNTRDEFHNQNLRIIRKTVGHIDPLKQNQGDILAIDGHIKSAIGVITENAQDPQDIIADEVKYELMRKEAYEAADLEYIQTGMDKIEIEKIKKQIVEDETQGEE